MNVIRADDPSAVFDSLLYGNNTSIISQARDRVDRYISGMQSMGRRVGGLLTTIRDYVYDTDRFMEAKQILGATSNYIAEDAIYRITDDTEPSPYMQALIMQNRYIWDMYKNNEINGYENTRLFDRYDDSLESEINSGWTSDSEEHDYYVSSDDIEFDIYDEMSIRDTWNYMLHKINVDVVDPTYIEKD